MKSAASVGVPYRAVATSCAWRVEFMSEPEAVQCMSHILLRGHMFSLPTMRSTLSYWGMLRPTPVSVLKP